MPNSTVPEPTLPEPAAPDEAAAVHSASVESASVDGAAETASADRNTRLAALLESARSGRRESLNEIVIELSPVLWQVARAQGLDREAAEDVIQCTWLSLLRHLEQIHSPLALTAWLITATKREAWRMHTAHRAEQPLDQNQIADTADPRPLPEELVLLAERHHDVWRAVRQLPQRCQELLRVVAFSHRPDYDTLAVALGMPRGSIGPTRGRCLAKLRTLLDPDGSGITGTSGGLA